MRVERGIKRESLDASLARIAATYGFSAPPVSVPRAVQAIVQKHDPAAAAHTLLAATAVGSKGAAQLWSVGRRGSGSTVAFSIVGAQHPIAHALTLKAALSIAERAGLEGLTLAVSSVGDGESKRRFLREVGNFFKKYVSQLGELSHQALAAPEEAYRALYHSSHELKERLPRTIDHLSEHSRKVMTDTFTLFESVGIPYHLDPYLAAETPGHSELIFAVRSGDTQETIARGGRLDDLFKRMNKSAVGFAVGMSLSLTEKVDPEPAEDRLQCMLIHIGDAAKLKAFVFLEALWRAHITTAHALLAGSLREQMELAKTHAPRSIAIIGQREALDGTVIIKNTATEMQTAYPRDKALLILGR